ncbi:hypothetical protein GTZ99_03105 [Novosphingobium sp. FSY-8]|uniref:SMODS and SLOG-associating 2TM effector domain-containing protein n=1 Tax=Novosphingobium ovatum TaxID=1908523 RepID=A0ABW9XAI2_9SPHN|nr:hypothetical protein [Novosphingobium ovatum]NBC35540.1 hypothetical protein [Novosphingobium ovatum]
MTRDDLEFWAEVSARYHRRRAAFLARASAFMSAATLFGGAGAFASLFGTETLWAKIITLCLTFLGVLQIVCQIDRNAAIHERWLSQWNELLFELHVTPESNEHDLRRWTERFYRIESECIGHMKALANDCFNSAMLGLGREDNNPYRLKLYHRLFMHFLSFENGNFK